MTDRISLGDLHQDPDNARKHTARNVSQIEESLQRAGAGRSILAARDKDGKLVILAGNATTEAAMSAGFETARIVESDGTELVVVVRSDLDPEDVQARLLAVADNRTAELATWDVPKLTELPVELLDMFFSPKEMGKLLQTMDRSIDEVNASEETQTEQETPGAETDDDASSSMELPQTQTGDVWRLGDHILICGESDNQATRSTLDTLWKSSGVKPAIIVTDPPYGIDYEAIRAGRRNQKAEDWGRSKLTTPTRTPSIA